MSLAEAGQRVGGVNHSEYSFQNGPPDPILLSPPRVGHLVSLFNLVHLLTSQKNLNLTQHTTNW